MGIQLPRILVIDDDPEICAVLQSLLHREGFPVWTAEDGLSALDMIKKDKFDLLITDIGLPPPRDGLETVRRAREYDSGLRSLFISGTGAARWDDPACDDFVSKPFNSRELVGCIWELFSRRVPPSSGPTE
jgi:two-component system phosphate regulon response regulator OmpR